MRKGLLPSLAAVSAVAFAALILPGSAGADERGVDHLKPTPSGEVVCMALHCPKPMPPEPGCYEGPDGDCLPPWCDAARPAEECPAEPPLPEPPLPPICDENGEPSGECIEIPPRPPICEEGAEVTEGCIELPPECWVGDDGAVGCLPPWCDPEAGVENCSPVPPPPPICDENSDPSTDFCIPPRPPICEEGVEASEDCIKLPPPPPWCEDGAEVCIPPLPPWCDEAGNCEPPRCDPTETNPKFCRPFPRDPIVCVMGWPSDEPMPDCPSIYPPPMCEVTEPGEGEPGVVPGDEGESTPEESGEDYGTTGSEDVTVEDPLPCIDRPVYGCFEDETGEVLCVDPPIGCWEAEGREGLIACYAPTTPGDPEATDDGQVKRNNKGKNAKAKARAAKAKKAKAKVKAAKAKKAKAKAKGRRG